MMREDEIPLLEMTTHDDTEQMEETACAMRENHEASNQLLTSNVIDDGDVDIQNILLETKKHRTELCAKGPRLPKGKEAHMFVSYSSNDCAKVFPIVADLERRFGVACVLADRDFHSGEKVLANIENGMEKSAKVLLFLSNNFLMSAYCMHERELAFVMSLDNAENIIIPVLLEDCEIPRTLKTLTYIDARKEKHTIPFRILAAFNKPDDVLPLHFGREKKKLENGFCVELPSTKADKCVGRPASNIFAIDETVIKKIKESKLKVTPELLQKVVDLINKHNRNHFWTKVDPYCFPCCLCCFSCVFFLIVAFVIVYMTFLQLTDVRAPSQAAVDIYESQINVLWVLVVAFAVLGSTCVLQRCFGKKAFRKLDKKLFEKVTTPSYKGSVLFRIRVERTRTRTKIYLRLIRYNVKQCETYLVERIIASQCYPGLDAEAVAKNMILTYLRSFLVSSKAKGDVERLPEAPENRHNVKGGRKCFCQILEEALPWTVPFDSEDV